MNKVTVVIPCYNAESYIDRCVKALENQIYKDFEVIFVDDASKDRTVLRLENIVKKCNFKSKIIINDLNLGPALSRNKGINDSSTEYITFCDADDWFEPNFLSSLINSLEMENADLAFCGYSVVDEQGNKINRFLEKKGIFTKKEETLSIDVDSLCMLMVRTSIMKTALLPNIRNGEDMAVIPVLMLKANKCVAFSDCLYNYYRRSDSASENPSMEVVDSFVKSFDYVQENFLDKFANEKEYIGIRNMLYSSIITIFSISFDTQKAKEILNNFEGVFPYWERNIYFSQMPLYKRIVLNMAKIRFFVGIWILAKIRSHIMRK